MRFNLNLDVAQTNLVIKGIETLRDSTSNLLNDIVGQIQLQAQANAPQPDSNIHYKEADLEPKEEIRKTTVKPDKKAKLEPSKESSAA